jgi:hypothetical protein
MCELTDQVTKIVFRHGLSAPKFLGTSRHTCVFETERYTR